MRTASSVPALAAGLIAATLAGAAQAQTQTQTPSSVTPGQPQPMQTAPTADAMQLMLRQQADLLKAQGDRIEALEAKLQELTAVLSNRVDRIEGQTDSGKVIAVNPGARIEGPNARNSMTFLGAAQVGVGAVRETNVGAAAPAVHGGSEIRRARIGVQGTAFDDFAYQVEIDLATLNGVASAAKDVSIQYTGFRPWTLTVGNIKPRTGMETSFSDRSNAQTFIEGSMLSSMYTTTGARNIGLLAASGSDHWSASLGWFGDDLNNNGVATAGEEGSGLHGRLTWAPIAAPTALLHVGVSGFDRTVSTDSANTSQIRVRSQPESTIDATRLIDTGNLAFAREVRLLGLESVGYLGPVGYQAEWGQMKINRRGRPNDKFEGAYIAANWVLTGESRVYDPRTGLITRFSPQTNVSLSDGDWGAWELAARWSTLDLDSSPNTSLGTTLLGVRGGQETDYTLGLNWYWNPYFRVMVNYVHAAARHRTAATPGVGADAGATLDLLGLRLQQEW